MDAELRRFSLLSGDQVLLLGLKTRIMSGKPARFIVKLLFPLTILNYAMPVLIGGLNLPANGARSSLAIMFMLPGCTTTGFDSSKPAYRPAFKPTKKLPANAIFTTN